MIATRPTSPATADPVAMPIVRVLLIEGEALLSGSGELVATAADVLGTLRPVPVAEAVVPAVVADEADVAVTSVSSLSRVQRESPLQLYPKGQQCDPQVGSCPVRFVVWTIAVGNAVAL